MSIYISKVHPEWLSSYNSQDQTNEAEAKANMKVSHNYSATLMYGYQAATRMGHTTDDIDCSMEN